MRNNPRIALPFNHAKQVEDKRPRRCQREINSGPKWGRPISAIANCCSPGRSSGKNITWSLNGFIDIYSPFTLGNSHKQEIKRKKERHK